MVQKGTDQSSAASVLEGKNFKQYHWETCNEKVNEHHGAVPQVHRLEEREGKSLWNFSEKPNWQAVDTVLTS